MYSEKLTRDVQALIEVTEHPFFNVPEILTSENLSLPITHLDSYVPTLPLYVTRDTVMNATLMHLLIPLVTHR